MRLFFSFARGKAGAASWLIGAAACATVPARAQTMAALADLSLEQLRDVVVSTVSRYEEPLERAAAAAYVISAEDIRRSGATTIPEALRLAPALNVARADANQYAISARGFNNVLANKMLVLVDGRTLYTPLFSGVFWEAQDIALDDIDRIEVISGPSTALWGSNAVNGLIHIITRSAADGEGAVARLNAGNRERGGALRYGLAVGAGGHLRLYAKTYDRSDTHRADGSTVNDGSRGTQAGFRADWKGQRDSLTVQGDVYRGRIEQVSEERTFSGANLLTRWNRSFDNGGDASVQAYLERTKRDHPQSFGETLETVDVVAQYGFRPAADHRVLLGAGYRHAHDDLQQFAALGFEPSSRSLTWRRLFAQDQITLTRELTATLATSIEVNPYTGTEVLPSARLAWHPSADSTWWAAVSRAVRAPSRIDREFVQPARPPYVIAGGPDFRSEVSNVLELGHRAQPDPSISYSLTAYYHQHRRLRSLAPTPAGLQFQNGFEGWTRGIEAWGRWRVTGRWQLEAGGNYLQRRLRLREGSVDVGGAQLLGNDPRQRWLLRSAWDITPRHAWDVSVRRVGTLPNPNVPSYVAVDTRLAWTVASGTELALQIQNVFDARHAEFGTAANRVELERAYTVQLRWRH